jgi:cytochrome c oxidase subunit 1
MSTLPFIVNMITSALNGRRIGNNPWQSLGLEWTTTSPPIEENFKQIPTITEEPYGYGQGIPIASEITP